MGYLKISNLYADKTILSFKTCYALEKVHGTSANIRFDNSNVFFSSGGASYENFCKLFDKETLMDSFTKLNINEPLIVYGEAYGGKEQGMSKTYGSQLCFIAFEVRIGETWLSVPNAEQVALKLGLEFVPYELIETTEEQLNFERDRDSIVALRRGMGPGHIREGVVLKPPFEVTLNNGGRIIAKHKRDEFREHKSIRKVNEDPDRILKLEQAELIADEWCVPMRLKHVLGHLTKDGVEPGWNDVGAVIKEMIKDIYDEADNIIKTKEVEKAIGKKTSSMFIQYLKNKSDS